MKGEINRDWYCSMGREKNKQKKICRNECEPCDCEAYHRKWPTPEQFREEYGEDYPGNGAVYVKWPEDSYWLIEIWNTAKKYKRRYVGIVCACTPWGMPPNDWRPE